MIGIELYRCVVDEAVVPHASYARSSSQPAVLEVTIWGVDRLVYLPGLAIVVAAYQDRSVVIVPVEHVWQMSPKHGEPVLEKLAEVIR